MKKMTTATVNAELKKLGVAEKLVKGRGYYYFTEGNTSSWSEDSVYVYHISHLPLATWLAEYERCKATAW
jgi:hypothetical protein